jgi:hypothetical protein
MTRAGCSERLGDRQAGDGHPLASSRVSVVLAIEVALARRQTEGPARNPSVDPRHEPRQPALGRSADPRRTPQTRHRCGSNLGRQVYGKTQETPVARVEDLPAQPRRWYCRNGSLCCSNAFLSAALCLLILWHGRRQILWLGVTAHPTAQWMARQLTEAFGWDETLEYLVRDHDSVYGEIFIRRLRAMGIRDRPIAPRSPWQNGHAERLIGSLRRECLDHIIVFGERHLRQVLRAYMAYYNFARTHLSLNKDAPMPRAIQADGRIYANPILGGLHHQYVRI